MTNYDEVRGKYAFVEKGITNRFSGSKITTGQVVEASGSTILVTPASGFELTVYWVGLVASENNAGEVLATVKLGSETLYDWYLAKAGAFAHWEPATFPGKLTIELSQAYKVAVNYSYTESIPGS